MCEIVLTYFIVGAMEVSPGFMQIEYMKAEAGNPAAVETVFIPTEHYLSCWDNWHSCLGNHLGYFYRRTSPAEETVDLKSIQAEFESQVRYWQC